MQVYSTLLHHVLEAISTTHWHGGIVFESTTNSIFKRQNIMNKVLQKQANIADLSLGDTSDIDNFLTFKTTTTGTEDTNKNQHSFVGILRGLSSTNTLNQCNKIGWSWYTANTITVSQYNNYRNWKEDWKTWDYIKSTILSKFIITTKWLHNYNWYWIM